MLALEQEEIGHEGDRHCGASGRCRFVVDEQAHGGVGHQARGRKLGESEDGFAEARGHGIAFDPGVDGKRLYGEEIVGAIEDRVGRIGEGEGEVGALHRLTAQVLEQDADVVMFIYRDDYYNKDTELKNVAEIIIAKQRNGAIGTINLAWLPDYTQFVNLEK